MKLPFSLWSPPSPAASVHLIGICGAGMKALAEFLQELGWRITGCDGDPDPAAAHVLGQSQIPVLGGHSATHLTPAPELLIYSSAVHPENPERLHATRLGIPQLSYVEALSILTSESLAVAIAGTHGKSTTTAMLGQILRSAGRAASVICGAESLTVQRSGWAGQSSLLVVEACEFREHFLGLSPRVGCILGIEPDHFDCYPTLTDAEAAYEKFARKVLAPASAPADSDASAIPRQRTLIVRSDCPSTTRILERLPAVPITFSLVDSDADWQVTDRSYTASGSHFRLSFRGQLSPKIELEFPGQHQLQNAVAAAACAETLGVSLSEIASGLNEFRGLARRFQKRPDRNGWRIVDDYAHHPSEIAATLQGARQAFPDRQLICVFQPHQISRTAALLEEFAASLNLADRVYLLPIYAARENSGNLQVELVKDLAKRLSIPVRLIMALDQVWGTLQTDVGTDAVILTLGAGNLSRIHHEDTK